MGSRGAGKDGLIRFWLFRFGFFGGVVAVLFRGLGLFVSCGFFSCVRGC